jgi:transcriptional regulator with XRE-family HTH domain
MDYISGRLIAAARAVIGISQAELAAAASLSVSTLKRIEGTSAFGMPGVMPNNAKAVVSALEAAGVEFIAENGGGPGVRLKKARC